MMFDQLIQDALERIADRFGSDDGVVESVLIQAANEIRHYREYNLWQPIETAPKDGSIIIVSGGMAYWGGIKGGWISVIENRYIEW